MIEHDRHILDRLLQGDDSAIETLFENYFAALCTVAHRILQNSDASKDVVQDVFVRLWTNRESLKINTSLWGYLKRSVINAAIDTTRRAYEKTKSPLEDAGNPAAEEAGMEEVIEGNEAASMVNEAIARLPDRCRLVFVLSRHEELTYKEIAEKLEISPKTVENQMSKALKLLRKWLQPLLVPDQAGDDGPGSSPRMTDQ